jgi:hypothetical protein
MQKKKAKSSSAAHAAKAKHMSDETAKVIDAEVKHVIDRNYQRSKHILMENMDILHAMKDALMKYETIDAKQIDDLMARREVRAPADWKDEHRRQPQGPAASTGEQKDGKGCDETKAASPDVDIDPAMPPSKLMFCDKLSPGHLWPGLFVFGNEAAYAVIELVQNPGSLHSPGHGDIEPDARLLFRWRPLPIRLSGRCAMPVQMVADGATIIDIGGESTRPGADEVAEQQELDRVLPDHRTAASPSWMCWISIDTSKAAVMREAVAAGADLINDISALREPGALTVAAASGAAVCLMHMQGQPRTMQQEPHYDDVAAEVRRFSARSVLQACVAAGIPRERLCLDPGLRLRQDAGTQLRAARSPRAGCGNWSCRCWWACRASP